MTEPRDAERDARALNAAAPAVARIVLLCGSARSSGLVYRALARRFPGDVAVIQEPAGGRAALVRRRVRRLGVVTVAGQLAFQVGVVPWLARTGRARYDAILRGAGLEDGPIPDAVVTRVPTVNAPEARAALQASAPVVVVVHGTRIIGPETLHCVDAPFVNMHAGITPAYRGVHGGYWALAEGRPELAGTTVHFVDEGIDTGGVIAHTRITPGPTDTFATYPALQLAAGVPFLLDAVAAIVAGREPSRVVIPADHAPARYHPTVWQYAGAWLRRRVR
jgi:hypothetical protein